MSYEIYKVMHLVGIMLIFLGLGAIGHHAFMKGPAKFPGRRTLFLTHGVGMLLTLVGGFGLLARIQIPWPWPAWVFLKFAIWVVLGVSSGWMLRKQKLAMIHWILIPVIGLIASYLANYKPF